jgi:2-polyprenyl-3-methyl-5-hydroxy-6-metoxy-1,4-benzoquinol methylase
MSHPRSAVNESADYYTGDRPKMLRLIPKGARRVLELGCGEGEFSAAVKRKHGAECWAMEYLPEVAAKAAQVLDRVLVGDADANIDELPEGYFDAIVCNDVLEHLPYPWVTLERLRPKLRAGGVVVASIPNIRHLPALAQIVFLRDFPQEDAGIFDRTHLRFFTKKSIRRMFNDAGYEIQSMKGLRAAEPLSHLICILSLGLLWDCFAQQYACVAKPRRR